MAPELEPLPPEPPEWDDDPGYFDAPTTNGHLLPLRPFVRLPLDLTCPPPPPEVICGWLYAGRLTVLGSEPGVGKSWLATWATKRVLDGGGCVVYLDEEGGPELVTERLIALGARPAAVAERLFYYAFEARAWGEEDLIALRTVLAAAAEVAPVRLAVLDSLPDFLEAAGRDEDRAKDVTHFVNTVCGTLRTAGVAQLVLDHLPKPQVGDSKPKRSRYSRGSGAKLAKADATFLLEAEEEFDTKRSGKLRLWKTKDRRGRLDLPSISAPGRLIEVIVPGDGSVEFRESDAPPPPVYDGPSECMAAIEAALAGAPGERFGMRALVDRMRALGHSFRDSTIREAAERSALAGRISRAPGARGTKLYSWAAANVGYDELGEDF